jgi:hypothetical protein
MVDLQFVVACYSVNPNLGWISCRLQPLKPPAIDKSENHLTCILYAIISFQDLRARTVKTHYDSD